FAEQTVNGSPLLERENMPANPHFLQHAIHFRLADNFNLRTSTAQLPLPSLGEKEVLFGIVAEAILAECLPQLIAPHLQRIGHDVRLPATGVVNQEANRLSLGKPLLLGQRQFDNAVQDSLLGGEPHHDSREKLPQSDLA